MPTSNINNSLFELNVFSEEVAICTGKGYENLFSLLAEIKSTWLSQYPEHQGKPIEMIFDLYNSNGNSDNRFAKINFDGTKFVADSFSILPKNTISPQIVEIQNKKIKNLNLENWWE